MTKYWLTCRFHGTGTERRYQFDSMTERAITIIMLSAYADILEQGEC